MRTTNKLPLWLLIILFIVCGVPAVQAQTIAVETIAPDFINAEAITCAVDGASYSRSIATEDEVDVYSVELMTDQTLIIDVDTEGDGAVLDTILFVYFDSDPTDDQYPEVPIAWNDVSSEVPLNNDPYLELAAEADGRYYLVIFDALSDGTLGSYTFSLKCTDPSTPPDPVDPLNLGDLLGSTSSDTGSLVLINPADGTSSVRFSSVTGPIADLEYQYSTQSLLVAINDNPGAIIVMNPDTGAEGPVFNVDSGAIIALEDAAGVLYGVHVLIDEFSVEPQYSLVSINQTTGELDFLASLGNRPITALAYHAIEKTMYGVVTGNGGAELIKVDLTSFEPTTVGLTGLGQVAALDFNNENLLYGVDVSGTLFSIPDLATGKAVEIAPIDVSTVAMTVTASNGSPAVSGLTFVVGEPQAPPDPTIKTICSSSFNDPVAADSESDTDVLIRSKVKRNPLHGAIGLFKFEGKSGEVIHFEINAEEEEPVEAEGSSTSSWIQKLWLQRNLKNRVFAVIRAAIPGVHFRVKDKGELPLVFEPLELPADGWYYIMVIRPLRRFHDVDYCLSLQSEDSESTAWETLDVAWPADESEEDTALTSSSEETSAQVQSDETGDEGSLDSGDTTSNETSEVAADDTAGTDAADDISGEETEEEPLLMGAPPAI